MASVRPNESLPRKGQRHVAWGASPRDRQRQDPQSPEGAAASHLEMVTCRRPCGALEMVWPPTLGLAPQATCLGSFGAMKDHFRTQASESLPLLALNRRHGVAIIW
jgi:hypothetical protein